VSGSSSSGGAAGRISPTARQREDPGTDVDTQRDDGALDQVPPMLRIAVLTVTSKAETVRLNVTLHTEHDVGDLAH
jgi:hypothetical protein